MDRSGQTGVEAAVPNAELPASGADEHQLMVLRRRATELMRLPGASGYAVCRIRRFAATGESSVDPMLGSFDHRMKDTFHAMGEEVRHHVTSSLLPFRWGGPHRIAREIRSFVKPISAFETTISGVGFPAKLGTLGNGFVAFFGNELRLDAEQLVHVHQETYGLLRDLLHLDVRGSSSTRGLNDRELQCLQLASDGYKSEGIAQELGLSIHTVNAYLGSAAVRLDAVNRIQAIAKAMRLGYIG